ncbi:MAG TPA: TIR domain-containing protein [Sphingomicrobium sp.]|nr:TIR domain-containing protein [Sphingomicrobium sp.]
MPDVFVSYARADEPRAEQVAEALRALGYEVWRDDELPAHRSYAEVIEERLKSAKAVVALWSAEAARSQWVRAEADAARSAGTLVQARLDGTIPPMPFNQIQCADLQEWDGNPDWPGWKKLVASVAALAGARSRNPARERRQETSICVLPFQNMSGDPEQEYFSDGISEDITTDLSKVSALEVIARNTAFTFKGQAVDVCDVARRLCVSHVLEGSVRKSGNRLRITAQLIDGSTGGHVWADRFDRDMTDIFEIQDEISKAIVSALRVKLLPAERKAIENRGTANAEAYNLYLRARQYWISGHFGDRRREERVIRICKAATEIDQRYAQAWALIALAQANLRYGFSGNESLEDGSAAAKRALALDPSIAEAHLPMAWRLAEQRRFEEADAEIATATRLGPDSFEVNKEAARILYRQRRLEEARRCLEKSTSVMESDFHGWGMLFATCNALGDIRGRQRAAEKIIEQSSIVLSENPDNGAALVFSALAFAAKGDLERARQWMDRAVLLDADNQFMRFNLAMGEIVFFDDKEAALESIAHALAHGGPNVVTLISSDPNLDPIRDDPRFEAMLSSARARVAAGVQSIDRPAIS